MSESHRGIAVLQHLNLTQLVRPYVRSAFDVLRLVEALLKSTSEARVLHLLREFDIDITPEIRTVLRDLGERFPE